MNFINNILNNISDYISNIILLVPLLMLSLSFHEYMHGRVSYMLGDPTPKQMGRLTMNPIHHLDLVGSLVFLITQRIGWAKPVPINPRYYDNPRQGMMYVGLAGPGANAVLAVIFAIIYRIYPPFANRYLLNIIPFQYLQLFMTFLFLGVMVNISLAIFNLLPFPPLDGSKILRGFLPQRFDQYFNQLEGPLGMMIIMLLAISGAFSYILFPVVRFIADILI